MITRRTMRTMTILCCVLCFASAATPVYSQAAVKAVPTLVLSAEKAQTSVIYMHLPSHEYGSVAFSGTDIAIGHKTNNSYTAITKNGRTVTFRAYGSKGGISIVHIMTKEGRTYTVIVVSTGDSDKTKAGDVGAKVVITS